MSNSYRRPYAAISGVQSAKRDKIKAHRGERRAQNRYLRLSWQDEDSFMLPSRLECPWNDVWCWVRDGSNLWQYPDARDWHRYLETFNPESHLFGCGYFNSWPPPWYTDYCRK